MLTVVSTDRRDETRTGQSNFVTGKEIGAVILDRNLIWRIKGTSVVVKRTKVL